MTSKNNVFFAKLSSKSFLVSVKNKNRAITKERFETSIAANIEGLNKKPKNFIRNGYRGGQTTLTGLKP